MSLLIVATVVIILLLIVLKIYIKLTTGWCKSHRCLVGKTTLITGANTGIGYETALDFAKRGARVILACRDEERAENARRKIIEETDNENVIVQLIDMSSFQSVRNFAKRILETEDRLDILVNNAGVGGLKDRRSVDGHVLLMQINYFSAFLLTQLLFGGLLKKTKGSRIINVSSIGATKAKDFQVQNVDNVSGLLYAYFYSKLCNILFTIELAKRLKETGIVTFSLHPGAVKTEIFRRAKGLAKYIITAASNTYFKSSEEGAQTTIYCSVAKNIEHLSGEHFHDCKRVAPYKTVDPSISKKLWDTTIEIIQMKPEEIQI